MGSHFAPNYMKITEFKLVELKNFLKNYKKRKIQNKILLNIFEEIVADYESEFITLEKNKGKK